MGLGLQDQAMKDLYNPGDDGMPNGDRHDLGSVNLDGGRGLFDGVKGMQPSGAPGGPQPGGNKPTPMENTARFMAKLRGMYNWPDKLRIGPMYG